MAPQQPVSSMPYLVRVRERWKPSFLTWALWTFSVVCLWFSITAGRSEISGSPSGLHWHPGWVAWSLLGDSECLNPLVNLPYITSAGRCWVGVDPGFPLGLHWHHRTSSPQAGWNESFSSLSRFLWLHPVVGLGTRVPRYSLLSIEIWAPLCLYVWDVGQKYTH